MILVLGLFAALVPGSAPPLVFFFPGIAVVVTGIVLYRLSPPEHEDDV